MLSLAHSDDIHNIPCMKRQKVNSSLGNVANSLWLLTLEGLVGTGIVRGSDREQEQTMEVRLHLW